MLNDDNNSWEEEDDLTKEAVSRFEEMLEDRRTRYFDAEEFELIIDYYVQHDDLKRSRQAVDLAVEQHPLDNSIRIKNARQYLVENNPRKAFKLLETAEDSHDDPDYYLTLGGCYAALGKPRTAIDVYLKALPYFEEEEKSDLYHAIGFSYQELKEYHNAIPYYKKSLDTTTDPEYFNVTMYELTECFVDSGTYEDGIEYLNQRIENNPNEADSWAALGDIYRLTDRLEKAIDMYEFALAIDPTLLLANIDLANVYYDLNRFNEAIDSLQEALSHNVESAVLHTSMGDCHIKLQHYIDAKNEYDKALKIDDKLAEAWCGLGYVHSDTGNSQQALSCFQKAYSLEPYNDNHLFNLASEYWKINEKEKALECLLEVEKKQPNDTDLYFSLGELLADMDRYDEAICYLHLGLQRTDNDPTLKYLLAFLHLEKGERQLALHYLEEALEAYPEYYKEFLDFNPEMLTNDLEVMEMVERKVRNEE